MYYGFWCKPYCFETFQFSALLDRYLIEYSIKNAAYFTIVLVHGPWYLLYSFVHLNKILRIKLTSCSIYSLSDKKFSSNNGLGFRNLTLGGN